MISEMLQPSHICNQMLRIIRSRCPIKSCVIAALSQSIFPLSEETFPLNADSFVLCHRAFQSVDCAAGRVP